MLIVGTFIVSCSHNQEMLTVINPDGSCYREFYSHVDSAFRNGNTSEEHNPFPVTIDSSWDITYPVGESQALIRRNYQSIVELANTFKLKPSHNWSDLQVQYNFDKKFRWFYTYYNYSETYPQIKTTFSPLIEFMEEEEMDFWLTGQPNLTNGMNGIEMKEYIEELNDKYNQWLAYNYWLAMYNVLINHYEEFDLSISKENFISLRDSLFNKINFEDVTLLDDNTYIGQKLDELLSGNKFTLFFSAKDSPMKNFGNEFWNQDFMKYPEDMFTFKLLMPGEVLKAEKAVNQNDTLIWRITAYRMIYDNYTLQARSRKANSWAFIITGILIILAGVSLVKLKTKFFSQ